MWCGNYWGNSGASAHLQQFIDALNTTQLREFAALFTTNDRVKTELFQSKPKALAMALLATIKGKLTIQAHLDEIDAILDAVKKQ